MFLLEPIDFLKLALFNIIEADEITSHMALGRQEKCIIPIFWIVSYQPVECFKSTQSILLGMFGVVVKCSMFFFLLGFVVHNWYVYGACLCFIDPNLQVMLSFADIYTFLLVCFEPVVLLDAVMQGYSVLHWISSAPVENFTSTFQIIPRPYFSKNKKQKQNPSMS